MLKDSAGAQTKGKGKTAWIGLGANLGNAAETLDEAINELARSTGILSVDRSAFYQSEPVDASGPIFVNAVAKIQTTLSPMALLDLLQEIENRHGRLRPYRNAPRTLDLDILLFEEERIDTPRLTIPHPRMHQRAFVLRPMLDMCPDLMLQQGSGQELLKACLNQKLWPA